MKKLVYMLTLVLVSTLAFGQKETDTLYYDKDWKGIEGKAFATYYRVIPVSQDSNIRKPLRDYYITGELQAEGYYLTIDKHDDSKSIFEGEQITYFKNGLISSKLNFNQGKINGLFTSFSEDGNQCFQQEYKDGEPLYDWYIVSDKNGSYSKIRTSDNTPIFESPDPSEMKVEYQNGETWPYYNKNGLTVGMTYKRVNDYGKWFQVNIVITNKSMLPIDFDPTEITAVLIDNKDNPIDLRVFSADDYMKKVRRIQNWTMALVAFAGGISAGSAGYSTYTTTNYYSGSYGGTPYYGSTISTTTTYNAAAAYQAQVVASNQLAECEYALLSEREVKDAGYLKLTTIYPGESISGYVNVERKKGLTLYVKIKINDAIYIFPWNIEAQ